MDLLIHASEQVPGHKGGEKWMLDKKNDKNNVHRNKPKNRIVVFFQNFWSIVSYNKVVMVTLIIFLGIILFAFVGPVFLRDPFEEVREWEYVEEKEQFASPQLSKNGIIGQMYNISGEITDEVYNTDENQFYIKGRMLTWELPDITILGGVINFSLWKGNLSIFMAINEMVDTQNVYYDETQQEFNFVFTLNLTTENVESEYVITFIHNGSSDYTSGDILYQLHTDVTWYQEKFVLQVLSPPTPSLPLGTDEYAHDMFAQLANATRNSLIVGFFAGIIATLVSITIGSIAGYVGGFTDDSSQLIVNIMMVFPIYPLLIILAGFVEERSLVLVAGIIAIILWPWAARAIRSQILSLKERDFVRLAKISGKRGVNIAIKELLPNMAAYLLLVLAIQIGAGIAAEAGISMIGFGPDPQVHITLGTMLYWVLYGESIRSGFWWLYLPPGIILTVLFVILYVLQANLDEIFNPRLRKG